MRRASYIAHEHNSKHKHANDHAAATPAPDQSVVDGEILGGGESVDSAETIDGQPIELEAGPAGPAVAPVFVDALEPPDAEAPERPEYCVSREIPLDDPAGSWRLIGPGTIVRGLPAPGDDERNSTPFSTRIGELNSTVASTNGPSTATTTTATTPTFLGPAPILAPKMATRSIVFDCPANFPVMRFKDRFKSYEGDGVRIVEGMILRIAADGSYEVEFQAEGISTPAVVRLQLEVTIEGKPTGTLTLPAINLDPRNQIRSDPSAPASWLVVHRGNSSRLRLAFVPHPTTTSPYPQLEVVRDGVARFGSGVPPAQALPR